MATNENLKKANKDKKNEFYTQYDDIQKELNYYTKHFKGKTVYCNCDDPVESQFCYFFLKNFNFLGLKRLICTCYKGSPVAFTIMDWLKCEDGEIPDIKSKGYVLDIREIKAKNKTGITDEEIEKLLKNKKNGMKELNGDGDFRSEECIEYLKQSDIVCTNPPFSLFREYVSTLVENKKKFIILGNQNALSYKDIFSLVKDNELWLGASIHSGDREFRVPDDYPLNASGIRIDERGNKYIRVKGVRWFTNLDYKERHEDLPLYKKYNKKEYPTYDNFDAINVDKTSDIPIDYKGIIGVPITFMDKFNPEQFEIIGLGIGDLGQEIGISANFSEKKCKEYKNKNKGFRKGMLCYTNEKKELVIPYARILIKNKKVGK